MAIPAAPKTTFVDATEVSYISPRSFKYTALSVYFLKSTIKYSSEKALKENLYAAPLSLSLSLSFSNDSFYMRLLTVVVVRSSSFLNMNACKQPLVTLRFTILLRRMRKEIRERERVSTEKAFPESTV
jgi:hypothetical protein